MMDILVEGNISAENGHFNPDPQICVHLEHSINDQAVQAASLTYGSNRLDRFQSNRLECRI
jgi:hypothetical protein